MHDVAVIGAGPYGLSLAAHLAKQSIDVRVFGVPMQTWSNSMPSGMHLKSEGFASSLYDPEGLFPLSAYCSEQKVTYAHLGVPVSVDTFADYGRAFQKRFVPRLEQSNVLSVRGTDRRFSLDLAHGETATFRNVVIATGISSYAYVAEPFCALPDHAVSHSSKRRDYSMFSGKDVAVIGGGSSATDCAAALVRAGARVQILTRRPELKFQSPPQVRTAWERMRQPTTTIGRGWKSVFLTRGPLLFYNLPQQLRHTVTGRYLGPASCWFTRQDVENQVVVHARAAVTKAAVRDSRVRLDLQIPEGPRSIDVDHVITATGFKVDVDRLTFLEPELRARIDTVAQTPVLSPWFGSSVPGLFFVGASSAYCFGPLVRFACGARFTSRRLAAHLARPSRRSVGHAAHGAVA